MKLLPNLLFFVLATMFSPALAQEPNPSPQVHAIVIGINQYDDQRIPSCKTAVRDAQAVGNWFVRTAGWRPGQLLSLNDNGDALPGDPNEQAARTLRPTRGNLLWAFHQWLDARVKPGDRVVIYYAGQAIGRSPGRKEIQGKTYILPRDANRDDLDGTALVLDEVIQQRAAKGENPTLIWLDTSTRGRGAGLPEVAKAPTGLDWLRTLARWPGVSAWLAADGSIAPDGNGPGPFVKALTAALGDPDKDARTVLGALAVLQRSPSLSAQGFRTLGGVDPSWSIWSKGVRVATPPTPELVFQRGHADRVTGILATADVDRLITASEDSTLRIWRASDGALLRVLTDPLVGVSQLAMSPDGRIVAYGDGAGRVQAWDLVDDRPLRRPGPPFHAEPITALAFLPDGKHFASVDREGKSGLWTVAGAALDARTLADEPLVRVGASATASPVTLAASTGEGKIILFDGDGKPARTLDGPGGFVSALDVSPDGRFVGAGTDAGVVTVWDAVRGAVVHNKKLSDANPTEIKALRLGEGVWVAADDATAWAVSESGASRLAGPDGKPWSGQMDRVEVSPDGRWIALATKADGELSLWSVEKDGPPKPVAIDRGRGECLAVRFTTDSRVLMSGDGDGGIRRWDLGREARKASPRPRIEPGRGKVATLAASPTGKYLLEITRDGEAIVWDLKDGREPSRIAGNWSAGAFLAVDDQLALLSHPDSGGDVVIVDRTDGSKHKTTFARPGNAPVAFGSIVVSKSGRLVGAASIDAQAPLACVWDAKTGELLHATRAHDSGLTAIDFSSDEAFALTASLDGTVKVWPLADAGPLWNRPAAILPHDREGADPAVTTARFSPANPRRIASGTRDGWIQDWTWADAKPASRDLSKLEGAVNAVAFSADGAWLVGSGMLDKSVRLWSIADPIKGPARSAPLRPLPHHVEQVNALAFVPGGKILATGSDDSTVRFWDLSGRELLGTVAASPRPGGAGGLDWLAYTSSGLYDGSAKGENLVRWRVGDELQTVEQYQDTHFRFGLMATLAQAQRPEPPRLEGRNARRIAIVGPSEEFSTADREVDLTIALDAPDTAGLRLYHDGIPVQAEDDFTPAGSPTRVTSRVRLKSGENRFYALASKPGAIDGRSNEVVIRYEGLEPPGRLHVIALGISAYEKRRLKYAHDDAKALANFLHRKGIAATGEPGLLLVRTDADATEANLMKDFQALREAVKGRPEDTVVVFLAGHTDVFKDQFYLLMPGFPFKDESQPALVAQRGDLNPSGYVPTVEDPNVLSYVRVYNRLSRLDALQRLVIVDACQAGAILSDPAVRKVQSLFEGGARKARNAYLLAARRGEAASEADALSHGLLTYVLLRGLREKDLKPFPAAAEVFGPTGDADLDRDGTVTTDELRRFADQSLPRLSARFPALVRRAGGGLPPDQGARSQGAEESFPLVPLK